MTTPADQFQLLNLAKHLFRDYCGEKNLDTTEMEKVSIEDFYNWYHESNWNLSLATEQRQEIMEAYYITADCCDFLHQMLANPFRAMHALHNFWPVLTLMGRAPIKHKVTRVRLHHIVEFADGKQIKLEGKTEAAQDEVLTDGLMTALFQGHAMGMAGTLGKLGVDALYAKYAEYPKEVAPAAPSPAAKVPELWLPGK